MMPVLKQKSQASHLDTQELNCDLMLTSFSGFDFSKLNSSFAPRNDTSPSTSFYFVVNAVYISCVSSLMW